VSRVATRSARRQPSPPALVGARRVRPARRSGRRQSLRSLRSQRCPHAESLSSWAAMTPHISHATRSPTGRAKQQCSPRFEPSARPAKPTTVHPLPVPRRVMVGASLGTPALAPPQAPGARICPTQAARRGSVFSPLRRAREGRPAAYARAVSRPGPPARDAQAGRLPEPSRLQAVYPHSIARSSPCFPATPPSSPSSLPQ
jgi:hypothetical protein